MDVTLVPVIGWGLDCLITSNRKVFIKSLREKCKYDSDNNVFRFYYFDRPITKVEVVGILVGSRIASKTNKDMITTTKIFLWIDDGTGVIMCMHYIDINKPYYETLEIGCLLSVKGNLILLETNDNPYGWVIKVHSIDVFDDPNKEALYWASSLLLHQSDYTQPFQCTKYNLDTLGISYNDMFQYCTCCNISSLSLKKKLLHIKEKLLYCKCIANHCHPDPTCDFRITFILYLLSRENVINDNGILNLTINDIISDTTIKEKAIKHLDNIKKFHDNEVNGLYHTTSSSSSSYTFINNNDIKSSSSSSLDNIDDNIMTVEILIQIICKSLIDDGILCEKDGKYTLLSIERFIMPLIRKLYNKDTTTSHHHHNNKKNNIFQEINELKLKIPIYKLEFCYSRLT